MSTGAAPDSGSSICGEPLDLSHRAEIEALLKRRAIEDHAFSELSFANLFLFRRVHAYRFLREPVPAVIGQTYDGRRHAIPFLGVDSSLGLLGMADCFCPVGPNERATSRYAWRASHAEDDSDYLFRTEDLVRLPADKRGQAERFHAECAPELLLDPTDFAGWAAAILDLWLDETGKDPAATDAAECREAIALHSSLGMRAVLVASRGRPCGFLLASDLPDGSQAVHFAKATRCPGGAYSWLFSRYASACGCDWLNFEQDLGHPGLRRAKRALGPVRLLRKLRLEPM